MRRALSTAILKSSAGTPQIDSESGIIRGVKLMELGKLARFAGEDGPKEVKITDAHISALLAHAGNRSIPIHNTHDWFEAQGQPNADSVEMAARVGALKAFRRDASGNLIGDAYLKDGQTRNDILWGAQHNPEDNCFSVVFSYLKDDPQCLPQNFRAADIVPSGAATTALFSEDSTPTDQPMTIEELIAMLADPAVKAAIQSILDAHESPAETEAANTEAAALEDAAGVTSEDKKPEDETQPAIMRAAIRINRATARLAKSFSTEKTALLGEVEVKAQAAATALLGKGTLLKTAEADSTKDEVEAALASYQAAGAKNRATAIFRLAADKPEIYNAAVKAGKL